MSDTSQNPQPFGPKVENYIARRSLPYAFFTAALTVLIFYILWVAQGVLVPLVTAVFLSFLIMSLKNGIDRIPGIGRYVPSPIGFILSFTIIAITILMLSLIVRNNVEAVFEKAPEYQDRIQELGQSLVAQAEKVPLIPEDVLQAVDDILQGVGSGLMAEEGADMPDTTATTENLRRQAFSFVRGAVGNFSAAVGGLLGALVTTFLYTAFLLIERGRLLCKVRLVTSADGNGRFVEDILDDIGRLVRTYISLKTVINLSVATVSYLIMLALGTDFAGFWALMIFAFGFVPIIGAIIAVSLPVLLTLIQPEGGLAKAALTLILLTGTEQLMSSVIEPRLMGRSLNLSPIVILISLATWGSLWGFPGMLLCIPMTVTLLIVLSQFEVSRPVAILLSDNGEIAPLRDGHTDVPDPASRAERIAREKATHAR